MDLPGLNLHQLKGKLRGTWAVRVSGNWRVTFKFDGPDAIDVNRVGNSEFEMLTTLDDMSLYTFNKNIAKHYFCRKCGVHPFHRPRSYPELWAVNIRCLEGIDLDDIQPKQVYGSKLD